MSMKIIVSSILLALVIIGAGLIVYDTPKFSNGDSAQNTSSLASGSTSDSSLPTLTAQSASVDAATAQPQPQQQVITDQQQSTNQPMNPQQQNKEIIVKGISLKTNMGEIVIQLFAQQTPKTAENFARLVYSGFYDATKFHRVINGFMIQGGDPLSKDDTKMSMWGTGGPGYAFADEIAADNHNVTGTIAMANSGPNTNGSQFFINVADNTFLDGKHTVFGKVVEGMNVVMSISQTQTGESDRPVSPVVIEKASLITE